MRVFCVSMGEPSCLCVYLLFVVFKLSSGCFLEHILFLDRGLFHLLLNRTLALGCLNIKSWKNTEKGV